MSIGKWLSAALDDPMVCAEMKADINAWFEDGEPGYLDEIRLEALRDAHEACFEQYAHVSSEDYQDGVGDCRDAIESLIQGTVI